MVGEAGQQYQQESGILPASLFAICHVPVMPVVMQQHVYTPAPGILSHNPDPNQGEQEGMVASVYASLFLIEEDNCPITSPTSGPLTFHTGSGSQGLQLSAKEKTMTNGHDWLYQSGFQEKIYNERFIGRNWLT